MVGNAYPTLISINVGAQCAPYRANPWPLIPDLWPLNPEPRTLAPDPRLQTLFNGGWPVDSMTLRHRGESSSSSFRLAAAALMGMCT
jgi:hypothetical protein